MSDKAQSVELAELNDESEPQGKTLLKGVDLIGHVEVDISVNAGSIKTTVDELFALKKGKVLSMEQTVDEPFTLVVNGKAVAKASLVAVGDNFGVQIVEIIEQA